MKDNWTPGCDVPDDQKERHYDVFEELVLLTTHLRKHGILTKISEGVRFARRRFGHYEMIDFLAVLAGLCQKLRTHPGGILPKPPALYRSVHGLV
jgi:hypothetical protein